ncbi:MAG TPA: VWA domain-containing protein [Acidobacteriaceae bacterium]|jgi:VWFA-related protein
MRNLLSPRSSHWYLYDCEVISGGYLKAFAALLLFTLSLQASFAYGQTNESAQAQPNALQVRSNLVVLPALVKDKAGKLVYTLQASDFVLTDDGVPQKLSLEEDTGGEPLSLVVVIESGAANKSAGWKLENRESDPNRLEILPGLVDTVAGDVPRSIAVVGFDSHPQLLQGFTGDMAAVGESIRDFTSEDDGDHGAAILDALSFAVKLLRQQPTGGRHAILLVSETNDRGSETPLAEAVRLLAETNTTIFSVAYSTGAAEASRYGHKELPTKRAQHPMTGSTPPVPIHGAPNSAAEAALAYLTGGVFLENPDPNPAGGCFSQDSRPEADQAQSKKERAYDCLGQLAAPLALAKMAAIAARDGIRQNTPKAVARLTGGEYFAFNDPRSLERDLLTISNHLPNRYVLSFAPHEPHPGIHALELRVPGLQGVQVTARASYWANPLQ